MIIEKSMKNNFYLIIQLILVVIVLVGCASNKDIMNAEPKNNYYDKWHYYGEKVNHPCYDSISDNDINYITAYGVGFGNDTSLRRTAVSDAHNNAFIYINRLVHDAVEKYNKDAATTKKIKGSFEIHIQPYTQVDCYKMTKQNSYITLDIVIDTLIPSILDEIKDNNIDYDKELLEKYLNNTLRNRQ